MNEKYDPYDAPNVPQLDHGVCPECNSPTVELVNSTNGMPLTLSWCASGHVSVSCVHLSGEIKEKLLYNFYEKESVCYQ